MRVAFGFINLIQCFMVLQGYKGLGWGQLISVCDVLVDTLEGSLEKDIKYLGIMVRYIYHSVFSLSLPLIPISRQETQSGAAPWSA